MSNNKEWNDLSMRERASYIRKAVFRGLSNIDDIREDYRLFGGGGDTLQEDPIYKVLPKLLLEAGLDIRVSSGYRPVGRVGTAGRKSWHWRHGAVDIVPLGKTTFEDIENVIYNNPKIKLYLLSHNFGLLDETGRTKESRALVLRTGATGPHFHFGRDTNAVNSYRARVGALQGGDNGKVVYFTNPDIPLEPLVPLVSRDNAHVMPALSGVSPEEVLANISIPEPIYINDDKELDIAMEGTLPEIEVIGQPKTPNPLTILSLIQEVQPAPYVMEPYLIPIKLNTVGDLAAERNTLLQKDLEDRILSDERRRRLGYAYKDNSIEDDIRQMLFLRNMSANGGPLSDSDYYTIMERVAEENNSKWNELRAKEGVPPLSVEEEYLRILNDNTYDYRGYYNKYPVSAANADTHWPDEFKTAYHPTFSVESKYSGLKSLYNPLGLLGGHWLGDTFVPAPWQFGIGGNLYGGGGIVGITTGVFPGVTENETVRDICSWLPYTSTAIDIDNALRNPSASNLTWAGISTGLDLLSFGLASKIKRGIKAVEKMIEPAEKAATSATKRAERAKKVFEQAPTHKNYELNLKAEREAFEKNYVLNNQVDGLYKQLEDAQWYKSTWLPIMDGHGGVASQAAQTIFEGVNAPQKALGGYLNPYLDTNSYGGGGLMPGINIPSALKNGYNAVKNRLYRTITPQGYHLGKAAKEFIKGDTRDFSKFTPAENEVWARYLGVPYEGESSFEKAVYTPTLGGATYDDVIKFKDESLILSDNVLRQLLLNQMATGKNTLLIEGNESGLGTYTVSLGEDENGKYISYYDDWDINPTRGLSAKYKVPFLENIGDIVPGSHPFTVYGRRYYTDEDLRRVIER